MFVTLMKIARAVRIQLYRLSDSTILGIPVDVPLHLIGGALVFVIANRFLGVRRAWWVLITLVIVKELIDLWVKSSVVYIRRPTSATMVDSICDVGVGLLGGYVAYLWGRHVRARV